MEAAAVGAGGEGHDVPLAFLLFSFLLGAFPLFFPVSLSSGF